MSDSSHASAADANADIDLIAARLECVASARLAALEAARPPARPGVLRMAVGAVVTCGASTAAMLSLVLLPTLAAYVVLAVVAVLLARVAARHPPLRRVVFEVACGIIFGTLVGLLS